MPKYLYLSVIMFVLVIPFSQSLAGEDKELQKQRREAQKERQEKKNERSREITEATRAFQQFSRDLKSEYQAILKDLDTEFELKRVELQAERDAKVADAEAKYQKKWSSLFLRPQGQNNAEAITELEKEAKAYASELFRLKKKAAEAFHKAKMATQQQKNERLNERDAKAMEEAALLRLTQKRSPIRATPIGGQLTRQEEQWNQREQKEVERIEERNKKTVSEFMNGEKLRTWEMKNLNEDFELKWREKSDIHKLEVEQTIYNTLLMQPAQGGEVNREQVMAKFTDLAKETKLIKIKYNEIRKKNGIMRRIERKKILGR